MAQIIQFRLDIDTGANDVLSTPLTPVLPQSFKPILDMILGAEWLDSVHGQSANDVGNQLDKALGNLRERKQFTSLPEPVQALRPQVEAYLENLRNMCREHPRCTVTVTP